MPRSLPARVGTAGRRERGGGLWPRPRPSHSAGLSPSTEVECKVVFQNCCLAGGGPPATSAAPRPRRPRSPVPQPRAREAGRPRGPQRAGPGTRPGFSPRSPGIPGRTPAAGLWRSHSTGATPRQRHASPAPLAQPGPRPRPTSWPRPRHVPWPGAKWAAAGPLLVRPGLGQLLCVSFLVSKMGWG